MYAVSSAYLPAIQNVGDYLIRCDAYRAGALVSGGRNLIVDGGFVTDDSAPGVRWQLDCELAPNPGATVQDLFDILAPEGTELRVRAVLFYPNRVSTETVPLGVYDITSEAMDYAPGGTLKIQADDKWSRIQRARFMRPFASTPGITVKAQITAIIRDALGSSEPVNVTATSTATVGALVWERDRDKAIIELAESIGAWVYFDRDGVATIANIPTAQVPVWTVSAGSDGQMLGATRSRDRSKTYNIVVVNSELIDDSPLFPTQYVWDNDPDSPTYAGPGAGFGTVDDLPTPDQAGPFGQVPYFYSSPLLESDAQGIAAGQTILARVKGLNAQLGLTIARNYALDAFDAMTVQLPKVRWDVPRAVEIHTADKIVHPLVPDGTQSIDTRSTRTDSEGSE